jgi:serine/threonine protein kinase
MLKLHSCTQGHFWESADNPDGVAPTCPECGAPADSLPLLDPVAAEAVIPAATFAQQPLTDAKGWPVIAGYQIQSELDRGPMGVRQFQARQNLLNRKVRLTVVLAKEDSGQQAWGCLRGEAGALSRLDHPNILQIHEAGERDRLIFYNALEHVGNLSLPDLVAEKFLPFRRTAELMELLARAVAHAHDEGLLHRNLRPGSVLLLPTAHDGKPEPPPVSGCTLFDEPFIPKLGGFGRAPRRPLEGELTDLELYGDEGGYLSPEQAWGRSKDFGPPTDVYGLGGILYFLLTGRPPFKGPSAVDLIDAIQTAELVPPSSLRRVPGDLDAICRRALTRSPRRRYRTAREMADDLRRALDNYPIKAQPASGFTTLAKWLRRRPALAGLLVLSTLGLIGGGIGLIVAQSQSSALRRQLDWAEQRASQAQREVAGLRQVERFHHYRQQILTAGRARLPEEGQRALVALESCRTQPPAWEWRYLQARIGGLKGECELETGKLFATVTALAIGPPRLHGFRQSVLAVAGTDKDGSEKSTVQLWYLPRREATIRFREFALPVRALAFAPDGRTLYTLGAGAERQSEVRAWALTNDHEPRFVQKFTERLTGLVCSSDGSTLFAVNDANQLSRFRSSDGERIQGPSGPPALLVRRREPTRLAASPDGGRLASFNPGESEVRIWDAHSGSYVRSFRPAGSVHALAWGEGNYLAVGLDDGSIRILDGATLQPQAQLFGHTKGVTRLTFSADGKRLTSASKDETVRVWGQGGANWGDLLTLKSEGTGGVAFDRSGTVLVVAGEQEIHLFGPEVGE